MIFIQIWRQLAFIFRLCLALVFLVAGGSKVIQPWVFVHTVEGYNMLPGDVTRPFALALPWIEVLVGLYLLVGLFLRAALVLNGILLVTFIFSLSLQILRGHTGDCGCVLGLNNPLVNAFVGGNNIGWWDVVRDTILLGMSTAVFFAPRPPILSVDALLAIRREDLDGDTSEDEYETVSGIA